MSAASPNPSNFLLFAALGVAAVWMISRNATAQAAAQAQVDASKNYRDAGYASAFSNIIGGFFGRTAAPTSWSTGGGAWNNPSAYVPDFSTVGAGTFAGNFSDYGSASGATGAWL